MTKLVILLILCISCSKNVVVYIDPELKPYYDAFLKEAKKYNVELDIDISTVRFTHTFQSSPDKTIVAMCTKNILTNRIDVDRSSFQELRKIDKIAVMFHEFAHCYLKRDHTEDVKVFQRYDYLLNMTRRTVCPASIMYPSINYKDCLIDNYNYYMLELFTNPNKYKLWRVL